MRFLFLLAILGQFSFADEVSDAKARLTRQVQLIESIEPYVERPDLARLYVLRSASQSVLASIEKNGLANKSTFGEFQKLIVAYRFSIAFFRQIETERSREWIVELLKINDDISKVHGFDDSPYTQITLGVYTQMDKLLAQLNTLPISDALKVTLANVKPVLGEVLAMAKAKEGDRRTVYPVAEKAYIAVKELYPEFAKIAASDRAFEITLEIQGLNEFYGEFAEFEDSAE